jgi:hypothetical protein
MSDLGNPVQWLGNREPWANPNYIPPSPHNLSRTPQTRGVPSPEERGSTALFQTSEYVQSVRDTFKFASITSIATTIGTTSIKFLDAPIGKRNFLGFRNPSTTATLYIDFNSQASSNSWLALTPGTIVLFDNAVPQDDLYVIASAASTPFAYAYSTYPG